MIASHVDRLHFSSLPGLLYEREEIPPIHTKGAGKQQFIIEDSIWRLIFLALAAG
jgi:hypothetical protein